MGLFNTILAKIGAASGLKITQALNETRETIEEAKKQAWRIRQPGTAYITGNIVIVPGVANWGKGLRATNNGTSASGEFPAQWSALKIGDTIADGSVRWLVVPFLAELDTDITKDSLNGVTAKALFAALQGKAASGHDHNGVYSPVGHKHDTDYAAKGHNHNGVYSPVGHNHDAAYLQLKGGTLIGQVNAPHPADGDDSGQLATTGWIHRNFARVEESFYMPYTGSVSNGTAALYYRKWSDGWIEQGGLFKGNTQTADYKITFPQPFPTDCMGVIRNNIINKHEDTGYKQSGINNVTKTYFTFNVHSNTYVEGVIWQAWGY